MKICEQTKIGGAKPSLLLLPHHPLSYTYQGTQHIRTNTMNVKGDYM